MTYGQALRTLMKKQGVSQIELAPRLAVLSNGTVHLKDADQPSAGARHHSTPLRRWGAFFVSMMCRYYRYRMQKYLGVYL